MIVLFIICIDRLLFARIDRSLFARIIRSLCCSHRPVLVCPHRTVVGCSHPQVVACQHLPIAVCRHRSVVVCPHHPVVILLAFTDRCLSASIGRSLRASTGLFTVFPRETVVVDLSASTGAVFGCPQEREVREVERPLADIVHMLEGSGRAATSAENNDRFRVLSNKINVLENRAKARRRALLMVSAFVCVGLKPCLV